MTLILIVVLCVICTTQAALLMADVYNLAKECIKLPEVNGTEDDVNDILMGFLPDTISGMCMLRCMETRVGIIVNERFDVRGTYMFFRASFPENPYCKNMERGVRFCGKVVEKRRKPTTHPCQFAHMVAACIKRRIKYVPGCKAAFYNPFVWKNPFKKATVRPAKKYFEVEPRFNMPRIEFEVITKPPKAYTLDDAQGVLTSSESKEKEVPIWVPPRQRKGKWKKNPKMDRKEKRKKKRRDKSGSSFDGDDDDDDDDIDSWDRSDKSRRHKPKMFRI